MGDKCKYLKSDAVDVEREYYIGQQEIHKKHKIKILFPELELEELLKN